ncbi:unnamed protein product [Acanthosepion pharaonis]|uniref:Uncharacterized protein n=1 Tax=Acanthosepion pharaonis TaxID=158019 RepID=A0A812C5T5_ACAPH|nr:unnamed protein product [Sepia pharaonis]
MEYEHRAAVVPSFHVGKKPAEEMASRRPGRTRTSLLPNERPTTFVLGPFGPTSSSPPSRRQSTMMEARATPRSPLTGAVTSSRSTEPSRRTLVTPPHRMLIMNDSKQPKKVKVAALLNELKHRSPGMLRFFSDERNFIQDQTSNRQNDRWICEEIEEVPAVKHTKFLSSAIGDLSLNYIFPFTSFIEALPSHLRPSLNRFLFTYELAYISFFQMTSFSRFSDFPLTTFKIPLSLSFFLSNCNFPFFSSIPRPSLRHFPCIILIPYASLFPQPDFITSFPCDLRYD